MSAPAASAHGLWWNGGDMLRTRIFDAISLLLPTGEQFVIAAVQDVLRTVDVPEPLRAESHRFIDEERSHQRAHRLDVARLARHAPAAALERRIAEAVHRLDAGTLATRIAFAAAFEVLTGLLSREVLRDDGVWLAGGSAPQQRLWRWHGAEEIGHGHVAVDLMHAAGVGPWRRAGVFAAAAACLATDVIGLLAALCRHDRRAGRARLGALLWQVAAFGVRSLPGWARIAGGALGYAVTGRTPR
ncbi:MAG: metal-dependent hydrolase [Burkholderiaceae bacterium]